MHPCAAVRHKPAAGASLRGKGTCGTELARTSECPTAAVPKGSHGCLLERLGSNTFAVAMHQGGGGWVFQCSTSVT
jgi:hypothetical protein